MYRLTNRFLKIKIDSLFPISCANTIHSQLPRTCFAVLVFYDGKPPAARTERRLKQGGIFEYLMHPTLRYDLGSGQNICSCLQTDTEDGDTLG